MLKMSKENDEIRKCKICGKTIVGKNKTGICSGCKKKAGHDKPLRQTAWAVFFWAKPGTGVYAAYKRTDFQLFYDVKICPRLYEVSEGRHYLVRL
jgi:hypothetical protein